MDYSNYSTAPPVYGDGGIYTHHKPDLSLQSKMFIKELIRESQVAHVHKKFLEDILDRGQSLPPLTNAPVRRKKVRPMRITSSGMGKRTQDDIRNSGAYDVEPFVPRCPQSNVEKEKARLQSLMTYGRENDVPEPLTKPKIASKKKTQPVLPSLEDRFQIILDEINERSSFLNEMTGLGQADRYRGKIQAEISQRVKELEDLSEQMKTKLTLNQTYIEQLKEVLP